MALFILGACSVDQEELEELFVELETSAESVDYGESFTLTWNLMLANVMHREVFGLGKGS